MKTHVALLLAIIITGSSLATVSLVFAEASIPKPSVPEFTLKYIDYSYDVPPTYKIDEYTGETVVATGSIHVKNMTIHVTINNQPLSHSFNGVTYHLYYNVRFKGHFGKDWSETPSVVTLNSSPSNFSEYISLHSSRLSEQSSAQYTTFSFSANDYPPNAPIDFQVEAVMGHDSQAWVPDEPFAYNPAHYYPAVAFDETSGWSSTQTITIPNQQTELQILILDVAVVGIIGAAVAFASLLIYLKKRQREAAGV